MVRIWRNPRFQLPDMFYVDALGDQNVRNGKHVMFLPHEIVGAFYRYSSTNLMVRLTGHPGATRKRKNCQFI